MSEKVRRMFADIADDYDRINTILSFGVHHRWRSEAVRLSGVEKGDRVLDCATGTGDLAIAFKEAVGKDGYVLGTDFCEEMIEQAPAKARQHHLDIDFEVADAMNLPYNDNDFTIASIAFGIRNVDDPVRALREMARVVTSGGRVVVLEFGQPNGLLKYPYELYSQHIMPAVGGWLSGNREAYTYLPKSSAKFPAGKAFLALMDEADCFDRTTAKKLTGGIAYIYVGT
ncbi:MAG TPA: bifunctional demethylmenaquinone methyltransferase/2-methoxy-6-polyprenyl-1,4-benzoquinol methylase UbiE, partial [Balneolaceae bacterium]|nr:bifunctional demethylmenaquinone methyltransferase/2-methoxy-6-polyprenyl-1,4-benzoquinol methylase UbiE [Balneolaceae bacterium]